MLQHPKVRVMGNIGSNLFITQSVFNPKENGQKCNKNTLEIFFKKFPQVSEKIFEQLDEKSLVNWRVVDETWQEKH